MKRILAAAAATLAIAASGCVREAQIRVPESLAAKSDIIKLSGMGGWRRGNFRLGSDTGQFTRGADRIQYPGSRVVQARGGGSFRMSLAGEPLEATCRFRAEEVTAGIISVETRPFAYECRFSRAGRPLDARLFVEAVPNVLGKEERRGFLDFEGQRLSVRSLHRDVGGGLPTRTPLGYLFEQNGQPVAAIDLNGPNKTLHVTQGPARSAAIAGSLALAILWDPADGG